MSSDAMRQINGLLNTVIAQGGSVRRMGNGHYRVTPPNGGRQITLAGTPGGANRSIENSRAALKRVGFKIDN